MLCSECPGWVCFAEKIVRDAIIPHMSTIKSPQQIMGNLVKDIFSEKLGLVSVFLGVRGIIFFSLEKRRCLSCKYSTLL